MIKIFYAEINPLELEKLEHEVNSFIEERGYNSLPVRTDTFTYEGKPYYVATVFYGENEKRENNEKTGNESDNKIGAAWNRSFGISGKINNNNFSLTKEAVEKCKNEKGYVETEINDVKIRMIPNQYKKEEKHPDWIIFRREQ